MVLEHSIVDECLETRENWQILKFPNPGRWEYNENLKNSSSI
jgi:hypothetical protein